MTLTGKEKRALRAEGNQIKPEIWIGKEGVTEGVLQSLENSFSTKELVKVKVLEASPSDKKEVAEKLSQNADAEVVQILGNTILLYRALPEDTD